MFARVLAWIGALALSTAASLLLPLGAVTLLISTLHLSTVHLFLAGICLVVLLGVLLVALHTRRSNRCSS